MATRVLSDFYSDDNAIKQFSPGDIIHLAVTYDQSYLRAWVNGVKTVEAAESSKRYVFVSKQASNQGSLPDPGVFVFVY